MHDHTVPASSPAQSWLTAAPSACTHPLVSSPSQWVTVCDNCGLTTLTGQLSTVDGVWVRTATADSTPAAPAAPALPELASPMELHSLALSALPASDPLVSRHPVSKALAYAAGTVGVVASLVLAGVIMFAAHPVPFDLTPLPECATEDSAGPCVWDATLHGNGMGRSFTVLETGEVRYW